MEITVDNLSIIYGVQVSSKMTLWNTLFPYLNFSKIYPVQLFTHEHPKYPQSGTKSHLSSFRIVSDETLNFKKGEKMTDIYEIPKKFREVYPTLTENDSLDGLNEFEIGLNECGFFDLVVTDSIEEYYYRLSEGIPPEWNKTNRRRW